MTEVQGVIAVGVSTTRSAIPTEALFVALALLAVLLARFLLDRRKRRRTGWYPPRRPRQWRLTRRPDPTPGRTRRTVTVVRERIRRVNFRDIQPDGMPLVIRYPEKGVTVDPRPIDADRDIAEQVTRYGETDAV